MKRMIPLVVILTAACAAAPVKQPPVSLGCGPTQYSRPLNAVSDSPLKLCFMSDHTTEWADGDPVARPVPAPAAIPVPVPAAVEGLVKTPVVAAKKKRHHK